MDVFAYTALSGASTSESLSEPISKVAKTPKGLREIQKQLDRQRLLIEVLLRALMEKGLYTREQLNALANLVDMEDGLRDGRLSPKKEIEVCQNCKRVMMDVSGKCLYCGHEQVMDLV